MTKTEQSLLLRSALASAIASAGTNVYQDLKDNTVQMYWKTCFEIDAKETNDRFLSFVEPSKITATELVDIYKFITN